MYQALTLRARTKPPVGTVIRWTSQSQAYVRTKEGIVVYSGRPFSLWRHPEMERARWSDAGGWLNHDERHHFNHAAARRLHFTDPKEGVIIRVERYNGGGGALLPDYYAPHLRSLAVVLEPPGLFSLPGWKADEETWEAFVWRVGEAAKAQYLGALMALRQQESRDDR